MIHYIGMQPDTKISDVCRVIGLALHSTDLRGRNCWNFRTFVEIPIAPNSATPPEIMTGERWYKLSNDLKTACEQLDHLHSCYDNAGYD